MGGTTVPSPTPQPPEGATVLPWEEPPAHCVVGKANETSTLPGSKSETLKQARKTYLEVLKRLSILLFNFNGPYCLDKTLNMSARRADINNPPAHHAPLPPSQPSMSSSSSSSSISYSSRRKPTYPPLPAKLLLISTKSYFDPPRTISYLSALLDPDARIVPLPRSSQLLLGLIPDFLTIATCAQLLHAYADSTSSPSSEPGGVVGTFPDPDSWPMALGAQDVSANARYGAHTGEVVAPALVDLGVSIVELGHAERRARPLAESEDMIAAKARAVCENGMIPLVCIGERSRPGAAGGTEGESEDDDEDMMQGLGQAMGELAIQMASILSAIPLDAPLIFAYEPVWAIGQAQPASVGYVGTVVAGIREVVRQAEKTQGRTGTTRVVYGGSAGPGLWSGKKSREGGLAKHVDGMFLGRFAHEVDGVKSVVDEVLESLGK